MSYDFKDKWEKAKREARRIESGKGLLHGSEEFIKPVELEKPNDTYRIHKRSLPVGIDKPVMINIETKEEAEKIINEAKDSRGFRLFGEKAYYDDFTGNKTLVFYEVVKNGAQPKEKNLFLDKSKTV